MSDRPCDRCPILTWGLITDPSTVEAERFGRRDERRLLAQLVRKAVTPADLKTLSKTDRQLVVLLAQTLIEAIAERENAA